MKEIRQGQLPHSAPGGWPRRSRSREGEEGKDFLIVSGRASLLRPSWMAVKYPSKRATKEKECLKEGRWAKGRKEGKCRKDKNSPDDDPFFLQSLISVCQRVSGFGFGSLGLERKNGTTNGCCVSRGCFCSGPILIT